MGVTIVKCFLSGYLRYRCVSGYGNKEDMCATLRHDGKCSREKYTRVASFLSIFSFASEQLPRLCSLLPRSKVRSFLAASFSDGATLEISTSLWPLHFILSINDSLVRWDQSRGVESSPEWFLWSWCSVSSLDPSDHWSVGPHTCTIIYLWNLQNLEIHLFLMASGPWCFCSRFCFSHTQPIALVPCPSSQKSVTFIKWRCQSCGYPRYQDTTSYMRIYECTHIHIYASSHH